MPVSNGPLPVSVSGFDALSLLVSGQRCVSLEPTAGGPHRFSGRGKFCPCCRNVDILGSPSGQHRRPLCERPSLELVAVLTSLATTAAAAAKERERQVDTYVVSTHTVGVHS